MARIISPFRYAWESFLNLVGLGPRRSPFLTVRDPDSRARFAQYMRRTQPSFDPGEARRTSVFLGNGGSVTHGVVRHASVNGESVVKKIPRFTFSSQTGSIVARRRQRAIRGSGMGAANRSLLNAVRVR